MPSVAKNETLYVPDCRNVGVQVRLAVPFPPSIKLAPIGRVDVVRTGVVPSGSDEFTFTVSSNPSVIDCGPIAAITGARLPASRTLMLTISVSTNAPSEARNTTL